MTTPSADFSGLDFDLAIGEVYGLRVWRMDDYGRLRPLHIDVAGPWRPGVNTATCHAASYRLVPGGMLTFAQAMLRGGGVITFPGAAAEPEPEEPEPHDAPHEQCKCGFYGFTHPTPETYMGGNGNVLGLLRGTGRTLIGAKGFRCEKAEIVALLDPTGALDPSAWAVWQRDRLRVVYPEVPLLPSRADLLAFAPIEETAPAVTTDEFWSLP